MDPQENRLLPDDEDAAQRLVNAARGLLASEDFKAIVARMQARLRDVDEQNRVKGRENLRTEAQGLQDFLGLVARAEGA